MPERINYSGGAEVAGGPQLKFSAPMAADAYDKLQFDIDPGVDHTVSVGLTTAKVRLLALKVSAYGDANAAHHVTFKVGGATTATNVEGPLLVAGSGTVGLLLGGPTADSLVFHNGLTDKVTVDILIARDPTP
jgi:hypothetical protein